MSCRRQAPTGRYANPTLVGGSDDEAAVTNRCRKSASLAEARHLGVSAMTELTQAELGKELGFWPATAKGWMWTWQRCGPYEYRKVLTHSTNPDHLVPSVPSPTNVPPLRITGRYAAGKPVATQHGGLDGE